MVNIAYDSNVTFQEEIKTSCWHNLYFISINYQVLIGIGIPVFDLPFFKGAVKHASAVHVELWNLSIRLVGIVAARRSQ
jgi:hypothetical protein